MSSDKDTFLESLKVPDTNTGKTTIEMSSSNDRDVYTCLKIMGDTSKVRNFLDALSVQEVDGHKIIRSGLASNYFNSIGHGLSHAEYDFREGRITAKEFNEKIDTVCKNHNLDFNYLMDVTDRIDSLEREPNQDKSLALAQEIETTIKELREKREKAENTPDKED